MEQLILVEDADVQRVGAVVGHLDGGAGLQQNDHEPVVNGASGGGAICPSRFNPRFVCSIRAY